MRALLAMAVLTTVAALASPVGAEGRTLRGTVAKVIDGDTVRVKVGPRKWIFHLAGVDAPELRGSATATCFGKEARKRLGRLVRRRPVRARIVRGRSVELLRGRTNINRTLVAGGHARAKAGGGRRGTRLRKAEQTARLRGRGLHGACAPATGGPPHVGAPPPAGAPAPGDLTGQPAIAELTAGLRGMGFRRSTSSAGSSKDEQLHLCADGTFRSWMQESFSSGGAFLNIRNESLGRPWSVTDAVVKADGSRAAIVRGTVISQASGDGPQPVTEPQAAVRIDLTGGQWHVDGAPVLAFPGQASCAPVLSHG